MTRQQRFEKMVAQFENAGRDNTASLEEWRSMGVQIALYISRNSHLVTIQSGNGVQEAMRSGARR